MLSTAVSADAGRPGAGTGPDGSSRQSPGAWKDIGGAMGKKYLEAFKKHKSITYSEVLLCCSAASHSLFKGLRHLLYIPLMRTREMPAWCQLV